MKTAIKCLILIASLELSSCVFFDARNVNPEVDQNPKSTDYREKYEYIKSREKVGEPTSVGLFPFGGTDEATKKDRQKVAKVARILEVIIYCNAQDEKVPVATLVRGKEVAWFLRRKESSPRDIAMTDQNGTIYIPHVANPEDEIIITYGKFVSKALKVDSQNPIEVHLHCY